MATTFKLDPEYDPQRWQVPPGNKSGDTDLSWPPGETLFPELKNYKRRGDFTPYTSREHFDREWQAMWSKVWTCAGRVSDLPEPGSFFRYDIGPESVLITRSKQGEISAFYNVCQHRGRQLVDADFGRKQRFVCPYHSWTYDTDGKNVGVTDRPLFSQDALCGSLDLKAVRCETWGGFVFVNFDPDAMPLLDYLGPIPVLMANYRPEELRVVHDVTVPIQANWKTGLEAFIEAYHAHITHPQILPLLDDVYEQCDVFPNGHSRLANRMGLPSPRVANGGNDVNPGLQFLLSEAGVDPESYTGGVDGVVDAIVGAKRKPNNRYGLDYSAFSDSQILDVWNYFVFPNMTLNCHPEGILMMRFLPDAVDPTRFIYHVYAIIPKLKDGSKAPYYMGVPDENDVSGNIRPARIRATMENPQVGEVLEQDISNMEAAQRGLRSNGMRDGVRFAEREIRLQVLHAQIDRYLTAVD